MRKIRRARPVKRAQTSKTVAPKRATCGGTMSAERLHAKLTARNKRRVNACRGKNP